MHLNHVLQENLRLWKGVHLTLLHEKKAGYETVCVCVYVLK